MKILGIDYGQKKMGFAVGDTDSKFAEPLMVIRFKDEKKVIQKIGQLIRIERVDRILVGLSEGDMGKETGVFGKKLEAELKIPVVFQDETLSTHDAKAISIQSGMKRKKRKDMEDAFSASLMLQNYLELNY